MNKGQYLLKRQTSPVLLALIVLTLFSSCSVRKSIQAQLDLPFIKQLNPAKTTITDGQNCAYDEDVLLHNQAKEINFELSADFALLFLAFLLPILVKTDQQLFSVYNGWSLSDKIPIYILYRKMKYWI